MTARNCKYQIAKAALTKKREQYLYPTTSFQGCRGFEKFIHDLPNWKEDIPPQDYDNLLTNMVTFFGTVPTLPNALKGIKAPDTVTFKGGFDKMASLLKTLGTEYSNPTFLKAAAIHEETAGLIEQISDILITYLTRKDDQTKELPCLFTQVHDNTKKVYQTLSF